MHSAKVTLLSLLLLFGLLIYLRTAPKTQAPPIQHPIELEDKSTWLERSVGDQSPSLPKGGSLARSAMPPPPSSQAPRRPPANPPPIDETRLPRAPDELTEGQFLNRYRTMGIDELVKTNPLEEFASPGAPLFVIGEDVILGGGEFGEFRFRQWISTRGPNGISPESCLAISGPDGQPIVASIADGSLAVRAGPIPHSYLVSILEKHYFLLYHDLVGTQEILSHLPPPAGSDGDVAILYFARNSEDKFIFKGRRLRWNDSDSNGREFQGRAFCAQPFASARDR